MFAKNWTLVRKIPRKLGPVWVVTRDQGDSRQKGFFKSPPKRHKYRVENLLANELISCRLAKLLNLNVAEVELAKMGEKTGIVSIVQPAARHYSWNQLGRKLNGSVVKHLNDPKQLLQTFVFDIWICNVDRHGGNIVTVPEVGKYSFYLIDHGLSLLGARTFNRVPWTSPYWNRVSKYNRHYVSGLRSYIHAYDQLEPFVRKIRNIPASQICGVIDEIPGSVLPSRKKAIVKKLLLRRQQNLPAIVLDWCREHNKIRRANKQPQQHDPQFEYYYYD
jgi:hypothetical protein